MKIGDLVTVKDPAYLATADAYDFERAQQLYPWKFEVGIVVDARPYGGIEGKEVYVSWPSDPLRTILIKELEVINEAR